MRRELVLLCVTALAVTLTNAAKRTTPASVLTRCKRPQFGLCMQFCEKGHKTDERGCPQCDCLEDPCENADTCGSKMCQSTPSCNADPCIALEHKCVAMPPCPMPMCSQSCEYGYKNDSRGCMSCQCKESPCEDHKCAFGHSCLESAPHLPFFHESLSKICLPDLHKQDFINLFPNHPMGYEPDEFPQLCNFREQLMEELKKQVSAQMSSVPQSIEDSLAHEVNCNDDGTFHPVQCNYRQQVCWCVNDFGGEIKDSRVRLRDGQKEPECEVYRTVKVEISMVITHNFDDVNEHMDGIRQMLVDKLSLWLEIDGQYIEINAILPHKGQANLIKVDLTITHDGVTDLAFVAERFKFDTKKTPHVIECHGKNLQVDGKSVTVKHTSKPVTQIDKEKSGESSEDSDDQMIDDWGYRSRCGRLWCEHKGIFFVVGFGILVFLLVIIGIVIAACRKRRRAVLQFKHAKMDTYKENLAYQNEVYGQPDLSENKEKDVKVLGMEYGKDGEPTAKY